MKNRYRNKKQNILQFDNTMSVQKLYVQKSDARFEIRIPAALKTFIEHTAQSKGTSSADLTIRLWLDYLSKAGIVSGTLEKPLKQEQLEDVEDFIKRANQKLH